MSNKKLKLCFNWFTYGGDAVILEHSLRSVALAFRDADLRVFIDSDNPFKMFYFENFSRFLKELDGNMDRFKIRLTSFPRGGNLNGLDCVSGMLRALHSRRGQIEKFDWQIKIDSDAVFFSGEKFYNLLDWARDCGDGAIFLTNEKKNLGFVYALTPLAVSKMLGTSFEAISTVPRHFPENLTVQKLAEENGGIQVRNEELTAKALGGWWTGWDSLRHGRDAEGVAADVEDLEGFDLVNFGNFAPGKKWPLQREEAAMVARACLDNATAQAGADEKI